MHHRKLKCFECEGEACNLPENQSLVCEDAVMVDSTCIKVKSMWIQVDPYEHFQLCWKSTVREANNKETGSRGCISSREQVPFYCNMHLHSSNKFGDFHIQCCQENLCNDGSFPSLQLQSSMTDAGITNTAKLIVLMLGPMVGLFLLICGMFVYQFTNRIKNGSASTLHSKHFVESNMESGISATSSSASTGSDNISYSSEIRVTACVDSTTKEYMHGQNLKSVSGSGLPMLAQRALVQQVTLVECLSSSGSHGGKFGRQIWRGILQGKDVAVKIHFSRDAAMWARENDYYLLPLQHDNILGYIGSDMIIQGSCTQLWQVTDYHKTGSLHNYLRQLSHPLSHQQVLDMCLSVTNGLLYLHTEIQGPQGKPAMAHRNLKSKNILVKMNGACVIADFAHAVTQDILVTEEVDFNLISKGYMSPELLEQTYDPQSLESFRQADIYSLGLVFWEVCRCCISNGVSLKYATPFSEWLVNSDEEPTLEEMKQLVIIDQRRPPIPDYWHSDPTLADLGEMIEECWYTKASSRPPIRRVKKTLSKIAMNNNNTYSELSLD